MHENAANEGLYGEPYHYSITQGYNCSMEVQLSLSQLAISCDSLSRASITIIKYMSQVLLLLRSISSLSGDFGPFNLKTE